MSILSKFGLIVFLLGLFGFLLACQPDSPLVETTFNVVVTGIGVSVFIVTGAIFFMFGDEKGRDTKDGETR